MRLQSLVNKISWAFLLVFTLLFNITNAQQFLWTTMDTDSLRKEGVVIGLEEAKKEVMTYYNFYKYYVDMTGFSRETILAMLPAFTKEEREKLEFFKGAAVTAGRMRIEQGSMVVVLCIKDDHYNMIFFCDADLGLGAGTRRTSVSERETFIKWFDSLLK